MKILGLIALAIVILGVVGFFMLVQKSKNGAPPGLVDGALKACPSSPNCISSEPGTPQSHAVAPLPVAVWGRLPNVIEDMSGKLVEYDDNYIAAEFSTPLMGFVDDVEFRKAGAEVYVRSASRVGHSDMGANAKRVEALRAKLAG